MSSKKTDKAHSCMKDGLSILLLFCEPFRFRHAFLKHIS